MADLITFTNVSKKFNNLPVLSDISFSVGEGEFFFLTGQTGAGKTTLIRLITRELLPTSGEIIIDKWQLSKIKDKEIALLRRSLGVIFQDLKLLQDKTLFENVALSLEVSGHREKEIKKRVKEILKFVDLEGKINNFPQELSGGELQRTAIARAVVILPKIILADEPTADLDPGTSWQIIQLFNKINKMGTTILFATHNADIVNSLKKRVISLKKGKIIKDEKEGRY